MFISKKKRLGFGLVATALAASTMVGSANADPAQYNAFVGVGSDTTQDVLNALSGKSNGITYTPVLSSAATGGRQVISFDATPPAGSADNCITPKLGSPTFTRPNGSSAGRRALSRAMDGTGYGSAATCALADTSGQVDFARSSDGPASGDTGTDLTYIPFGNDAVSFAYYRASGSPLTTLTKADLENIFKNGPQTIGTTRIVPCGIQDGSGTFKFWNTVTGASTTQENNATAICRNAVGRLQENDGVALKAAGDAVAALAGESQTQVIIGFSAGAFIAKSNGVAVPAPPAGVGIGSVSDNGSGVNLGSPVVVSGTTLAPNATFYGDAKFGRLVYNVFPSEIITDPGNNDLKSIFVDQDAGAPNTSTLCAMTSTINTFGFLVASNCGSTAIKGSTLTGQL